MTKVFELQAVFIFGGGCYCLLELAWRARTHWTMALLGGACFTFMYGAAAYTALPAWAQWVLSGAFITASEFLTGAVVNVYLDWDVWDYAGRPMNLYGQICAGYGALWFALSVPGCALARLLCTSVFRRGL